MLSLIELLVAEVKFCVGPSGTNEMKFNGLLLMAFIIDARIQASSRTNIYGFLV